MPNDITPQHGKGKFTRPTDLPGRVCRVLEGLDTDEEGPFANMVYRFAHIASGRCGNRHEDWVAEFEKVEAEVEERFYTSPKERAAIAKAEAAKDNHHA